MTNAILRYLLWMIPGTAGIIISTHYPLWVRVVFVIAAIFLSNWLLDVYAKRSADQAQSEPQR